jgi:hypothetical protein
MFNYIKASGFTAADGARAGEAKLVDRTIDINLKLCYDRSNIFQIFFRYSDFLEKQHLI